MGKVCTKKPLKTSSVCEIGIIKVEIAPGVEVEGTFSMTRSTELGLQNPCTDEEGYSFTACISSFVDTQVFRYGNG